MNQTIYLDQENTYSRFHHKHNVLVSFSWSPCIRILRQTVIQVSLRMPTVAKTDFANKNISDYVMCLFSWINRKGHLWKQSQIHRKTLDLSVCTILSFQGTYTAKVRVFDNSNEQELACMNIRVDMNDRTEECGSWYSCIF